MPEQSRAECPYVETRLAFNTRLTALEKEVNTLCTEISDYREEWQCGIKSINEKLERISDHLNSLSARNGIQDKDIVIIQEELKEKRALNRWTADKVVTILSSIFSPIIVAVVISVLLRK